MLNEDLRKRMGEAFEQGNSAIALELSQQLDKQVLKCTIDKLQQAGQSSGRDKYFWALSKSKYVSFTHS